MNFKEYMRSVDEALFKGGSANIDPQKSQRDTMRQAGAKPDDPTTAGQWYTHGHMQNAENEIGTFPYFWSEFSYRFLHDECNGQTLMLVVPTILQTIMQAPGKHPKIAHTAAEYYERWQQAEKSLPEEIVNWTRRRQKDEKLNNFKMEDLPGEIRVLLDKVYQLCRKYNEDMRSDWSAGNLHNFPGDFYRGGK